MKCTLVGDFNAKTAVFEDFSEPDETFLNVIDVNVEDDLFRYCYDYQVLLDNNISLKRYTQCECRPNNFVIFNYNGSFVKARAKLMYQACKALYCLYRKLRNISIPIDLQLKLFDTLILPIFTYGC